MGRSHLNKQSQNKISDPVVSHVFDGLILVLVHAEHDYLCSSGKFSNCSGETYSMIFLFFSADKKRNCRVTDSSLLIPEALWDEYCPEV